MIRTVPITFTSYIRLPQVEIGLADQLEPRGPARVVHQQVAAVDLLDERGEELQSLVRHVQRDRPPAALGGDLGEPVGPAGPEHDVESGLGEGSRGRGPDPAARARHYCYRSGAHGARAYPPGIAAPPCSSHSAAMSGGSSQARPYHRGRRWLPRWGDPYSAKRESGANPGLPRSGERERDPPCALDPASGKRRALSAGTAAASEYLPAYRARPRPVPLSQVRGN